MPGDLLCVQADEEILVSVYDPPERIYVIRRLNGDGTLDEGFRPVISSAWVGSPVLQPDNKILLTGQLAGPNGEPGAPLVRVLPRLGE